MTIEPFLEEIRGDEVDRTLLRRFSLAFCRTNLLLPLRLEGGRFRAALANEEGIPALIEASNRLDAEPDPVFVAKGALIEAIHSLFGEEGSAAENVVEELKGEDLSSLATEWERPRDLLELTEDAPVIRLVNSLLTEAVKEGASDIHVEPYEKTLEIRLRVDGILRKVLSPPKLIQEALITRIKVMADMDIAEKRLPQDGRIRLLVGGRDIDLRVSVIPTGFGERAVIRLLDRRRGVLPLDAVGLDATDIATVEDILGQTAGMFLVTGPTGSGKTTTLYACLNRVRSEEQNIITIEDPVEYRLDGTGQIQVNPKIGLSFSTGLRSILRQDPDVIMVGEIRDTETADIAVHAALTGHLVLSTLHTNNAAGAIARLVDMGIEPFLCSSALRGVLAQRLVRTVCGACKRERSPSQVEADVFTRAGLTVPERLAAPAGCSTCRDSGYSGRTGIFEFIPVGESVRKLIVQRSDASSIQAEAVAGGMRTLRQDGLMKAARGITTIEEVMRVSGSSHADLPV